MNKCNAYKICSNSDENICIFRKFDLKKLKISMKYTEVFTRKNNIIWSKSTQNAILGTKFLGVTHFAILIGHLPLFVYISITLIVADMFLTGNLDETCLVTCNPLFTHDPKVIELDLI